MKKLLLILICLFVSFEVKSFETTIFVIGIRSTYDKNEKKKEENYSHNEYFYINTGYEYFVIPEDIVL